jgi:GT2 family glycosyltransferase
LTVLFSVVIPTFDRRVLLERALASVWAQTCTNYEVIVVDDGSTDGTLEYLSTVAAPVRVIRQANLGAGAARNAGIDAAAGDYLAFLDSDDLWFPWTLEVMGETIRAHERPVLIAGRVMQFTDEAATAGVSQEPVQGIWFGDFLASSGRPLLIGSGTVVVRRDAATAIGGFTVHDINGEDADFFLRLGVTTGFVVITAPITVAWRRHGESATHSLERGIRGVTHVVGQERAGAYPGGDQRAHERREIITRLLRPVAFACVKSNAVGTGMRMYGATFGWHVQLGRWAYLAAFPLHALWALARSVAGLRPS